MPYDYYYMNRHTSHWKKTRGKYKGNRICPRCMIKMAGYFPNDRCPHCNWKLVNLGDKE